MMAKRSRWDENAPPPPRDPAVRFTHGATIALGVLIAFAVSLCVSVAISWVGYFLHAEPLVFAIPCMLLVFGALCVLVYGVCSGSPYRFRSRK
jgi:hypothetical protein